MPQPPHADPPQGIIAMISGAVGGVVMLVGVRIKAAWDHRTAIDVQEQQNLGTYAASQQAEIERLSAHATAVDAKFEKLQHHFNELEKQFGKQTVEVDRMKWHEERMAQTHADQIGEKDEAIHARDREIATLREEVNRLRQQLADVEVVGVYERAPVPRLKGGAE